MASIPLDFSAHRISHRLSRFVGQAKAKVEFLAQSQFGLLFWPASRASTFPCTPCLPGLQPTHPAWAETSAGFHSFHSNPLPRNQSLTSSPLHSALSFSLTLASGHQTTIPPFMQGIKRLQSAIERHRENKDINIKYKTPLTSESSRRSPQPARCQPQSWFFISKTRTLTLNSSSSQR